MDDHNTKTLIQDIFESHNYILDPHTAVAAEEALKQSSDDNHYVILSTAHPAKFPAAVKKASKATPELPGRMGDLFERSEQTLKVDNDLVQLKNLIIDRI